MTMLLNKRGNFTSYDERIAQYNFTHHTPIRPVSSASPHIPPDRIITISTFIQHPKKETASTSRSRRFLMVNMGYEQG